MLRIGGPVDWSTARGAMLRHTYILNPISVLQRCRLNPLPLKQNSLQHCNMSKMTDAVFLANRSVMQKFLGFFMPSPGQHNRIALSVSASTHLQIFFWTITQLLVIGLSLEGVLCAKIVALSQSYR